MSVTRQVSSIKELPGTVKDLSQLAPRQIQDEISLAKVELKDKARPLAFASVGFGIALVFVFLLVIGLVVAAILGLSVIMAPWLAALIVCAAFLIIAGIGALIGRAKLKSALPLVPQQALRGIKHDLGILREGSDFDASILDPESPAAKEAARLKEEAKAEAKAKAQAEAARKAEEQGPDPTEAELLKRLSERRTHLSGLRDDLSEQTDVKSQASSLLGDVKEKVSEVQESAQQRFAAVSDQAQDPDTILGSLASRWKPIAVALAASAATVVLLRKIFKS